MYAGDGDLGVGVLDEGDLDVGVLDGGVLDEGVLDEGVLDEGDLDVGVLAAEEGVLDVGVLDEDALGEGIDIFGGDTHERVRTPIQCAYSKVSNSLFPLCLMYCLNQFRFDRL